MKHRKKSLPPNSSRPEGVAQAGKRQHVPKHLKQNHVQEKADVAESFALRFYAENFDCGGFFGGEK